jgi:hypothetical protein
MFDPTLLQPSGRAAKQHYQPCRFGVHLSANLQLHGLAGFSARARLVAAVGNHACARVLACLSFELKNGRSDQPVSSSVGWPVLKMLGTVRRCICCLLPGGTCQHNLPVVPPARQISSYQSTRNSVERSECHAVLTNEPGYVVRPFWLPVPLAGFWAFN